MIYSEYSFSYAEYSHFLMKISDQNWGTDVVPWKEFPPEWKKVLMSESSFSLSIDSEPVKLRKWNHHYREFIGYEDVMIVQFYVQFEANTFEADVEYVFTGSWIQEGVTLLVIENVVTFQ